MAEDGEHPPQHCVVFAYWRDTHWRLKVWRSTGGALISVGPARLEVGWWRN